ncbi:S1 family peptidase [Flavihumibacter sp.]|uniref:S1 family peptidase n=1 Tax=Flavihumibacter sp. TaxID=1913981 RepID=UPI002FC85EDB
MLTNNLGQTIAHNQAIFPLIAYVKRTPNFICVGTAFFINPNGWFVTAKHVLYDNNNNIFSMIMGVQTLSNKNLVLRPITHLSIHPQADIALGKLGQARDEKAQETDFEMAHIFKMSMKPLEINDKIAAYGYPRTSREFTHPHISFNFTGNWTTGLVQSFLPEGSPIVRNRCYQTSMFIDSGSSGGPVFRNNCVVGVNSSGMDLEEGSEPLSFITPIDFLLDLQAEENEQGLFSIRDLINLGIIDVEN